MSPEGGPRRNGRSGEGDAPRVDARRSRPAERAARVLRVACLAGLLVGPLALLPSAPGGSTAATGFRCHIVFGSTPAALLLPNVDPTSPLAAGDSLGYQFQYQDRNYSTALLHRNVTIPETVAVFPLSGGGTATVYGAGRTIPISGPNWTSPSLGAAAKRLAAPVHFPAGATANLTTMKLAVMAEDGYGSVHLAFRWRWTETPANGTTAYGPWSVPNASAFHPGVLYPAPFVRLVTRSPSPVVLGTNMTATLTGWISNEPFFLELEHPDGHVVSTRGETAPPGNSTPFVVRMGFESSDDDLAPGPMLLHIHNHCGSMLYSLGASGVFASSATVTLATNNVVCGRVDFNGTSHASGSTVGVTPSTVPVAITAPACPGFSFAGWTTTGTLDVTSPGTARTTTLIGNNGTLTANYH